MRQQVFVTVEVCGGGANKNWDISVLANFIYNFMFSFGTEIRKVGLKI